MAIGDDFEIQADGDIRHVSGSTNYTVIEFHRWLGDLMDDAEATGDDYLDITDTTSSDRSTDNIVTLLPPYNIDDTTSQFLYDGSIIQNGGADIYDGLVVIANAGMYLNIIQNGALATNFWTTGINADTANGISHRFMLKVRSAGADIDGRRIIGTTREFGFSYSEFKVNGTSRGNNVLALNYVTDLNNQTASATVAGYTTITNSTEGYVSLDIDSVGGTENYYSEWNKDTYTINDFYERMKYLTRRGTAETIYGLNGALFRGITHEINLSTGSGTWGTPEHEEVTWSGGTGRLLAVNNKTGTATTKMWIQLLTGVAPTNTQVITGTTSSATGTASGTATERTISTPFIGASTGSALIGAYGIGMEVTDVSAADTFFDLTNTDIHPPNNVTFTVSGLVSGEDRVLVTNLGYDLFYSNEASGPFTDNETLSYTGGTARLNVLVDNGATGRMNIRVLTGVAPTAGLTITGGGSGASADIDSIAIGIDQEQLTLNGTLSGAAVTSVVVNEAIPTDTPSTGTIRIQRANGFITRHPYSAWATSTFTITSHDFSTNNATTGDGVFISYIDTLAGGTSASFTGVYAADRSLFIRVRDGGASPIKTFETTGTLSSAGGSSTAIRTTDA